MNLQVQETPGNSQVRLFQKSSTPKYKNILVDPNLSSCTEEKGGRNSSGCASTSLDGWMDEFWGEKTVFEQVLGVCTTGSHLGASAVAAVLEKE